MFAGLDFFLDFASSATIQLVMRLFIFLHILLLLHFGLWALIAILCCIFLALYTCFCIPVIF